MLRVVRERPHPHTPDPAREEAPILPCGRTAAEFAHGELHAVFEEVGEVLNAGSEEKKDLRGGEVQRFQLKVRFPHRSVEFMGGLG